MAMELGIYTFGDIVPDAKTGRKVSPAERMDEVIAAAKIADEVGLDVFGLGEHHTLNFVASATATVLAAAAMATKNIRLTSASTLISTADPVRTFQEFATADLISKGRVEVIVGRGAFPDHFPLFGYDMDDYDAAFIEKVLLFGELNNRERVTWSGKFRPSLSNAEIAPRPFQSKLPLWIGALSPNSVARAATLGLPLAMPLLGNTVQSYARLANLYRSVWQDAGHLPADMRIAAFSHMHVDPTVTGDRDDFLPYYSNYFAFLGGRGGIPKQAFDQMCAPDGALMIGSPQQIIDRLMSMHEAIGLSRYVGQIDVGGQPFSVVAKAIELFGTEVAPVIRRETGQ